MGTKEPKVLTFDMVGTLIDFEGGMLGYLRENVPASRSLDDDTILKAYTETRSEGPEGPLSGQSGRTPIRNSPASSGGRKRRRWARGSGIRSRPGLAFLIRQRRWRG